MLDYVSFVNFLLPILRLIETVLATLKTSDYTYLFKYSIRETILKSLLIFTQNYIYIYIYISKTIIKLLTPLDDHVKTAIIVLLILGSLRLTKKVTFFSEPCLCDCNNHVLFKDKAFL